MSRIGIFASQITRNLSTNSFESIQTVTVGSGGAASIDFTSIPSTYKHLQIRGIGRNLHTVTVDTIRLRFNGDTSTNYQMNSLYGYNGSLTTYTTTVVNQIPIANCAGNSAAANIFAPFVFDVLDYSNTNKAKTLKILAGIDTNSSSSEVDFNGAFWNNTAAISSMSFYCTTANLAQGTQIALYGVKG